MLNQVWSTFGQRMCWRKMLNQVWSTTTAEELKLCEPFFKQSYAGDTKPFVVPVSDVYLKRSHPLIAQPCSTSEKLQTVICDTIYQAWMIIEWKCPQIWMTNINMIMKIIDHHLHHNNDHPHPTQYVIFDWQLIIFLLFLANSLKLWNWSNCEINRKIQNWPISWKQILYLIISIFWLTAYYLLMLFVALC